MKKRHFFFTLIICGIIALIVYRISENSEKSKLQSAKRTVSIMGVEGQILKAQRFADNINLSGTLEANEEIELRSEVSGIIENINFEEGSKVSKGQDVPSFYWKNMPSVKRILILLMPILNLRVQNRS